MKEEALLIASRLDTVRVLNNSKAQESVLSQAQAMIRRLVEELDYLKNQISFYEIKDLDSGIIGKIGDCQIHDLVHRTKPQTKPLSDEEILEILIDKGICGRLKDGSLCYWQADADLHDFARTIEERHGIK